MCISRLYWLAVVMALGFAAGGCTTYSAVVKPIPKLSVLSPELENLTDAAIETYLTADVRPVFPSRLAVAKLTTRVGWGSSGSRLQAELEMLHGEEADGWRTMVGPWADGEAALLEQLHFVNPLLAGQEPTLKALRDAAALLHAPLLFVYLEGEKAEEGYNDAAMAYWTVVGLFFVPGNTVGHYTVYQGILVDTRSGFILAAAQGESKREENVLAGAVDVAADRLRRTCRTEAVADLQGNFRRTLQELGESRGVRTRTPEP